MNMKLKKIASLLVAMLAGVTGMSTQAAEETMRCGAGMMMKSDKTSTSSTDMSMDHSAMQMQGGSAPADARDHAFSDGYTLDPKRQLKLHDEDSFGMIGFDELEKVDAEESVVAFNLHARYGRDYNKLVFMAEGDVEDGKLEESMTGLFWNHALDAYWDTQLGLRFDRGMEADRDWLALGVLGLAPYWFEVRALAYVGEDSRSALSFEAEYEMLFTQRLILQPAVELNAYGKSDAGNELGSGLADVAAGLRLRYEITRQFAPYVGVEWTKLYGETADMARAMDRPVSDSHWVVGLRVWY
jgi:copper resistance protein B